MNYNRQVLRATQNRLPLQHVSTQRFLSIETINKSKLTTSTSAQQENLPLSAVENKVPVKSRPILTAIRSIKHQSKDNENETEMLISPMVKAGATSLHTVSLPETNKTREQAEQDLYELPDYRQSIFEHLRSVEHLYKPKTDFMENQSDINSPMRTVLVDWLIEVTDEYKLTDDTLFLCVQYIDRFLSAVNVTRSKLQLLGTTCMYVAAKYEEMYPPALEEFSFITDNTYETTHILRMEQIVMKMLSFSLSGPTSYTFLQYYLTHLKSSTDNDDDHKSLTMLSTYLCTLTLLHDQPFASHRPSLIAGSSLLLATQLLKISPVASSYFQQLTTYTECELSKCTFAIAQIHSETYRQDTVTSSIVRRYLSAKNDDELYHKRVRDLIHHSKCDEDDDVIDLTLDEFDENDVSMEHHR